ncbi:hypothetical protein BLNAU_14283 [Blattamonas nauphoetae]|uniref:Uncharacterized protein n=1 Tax=Blattamonas nauphoetae TaxID=2049346 RepID=A0ABQ9XIX5_9EUKA|nr:hypothetical protein BLNAU_14283 [Blattamonas nauphoetae]
MRENSSIHFLYYFRATLDGDFDLFLTFLSNLKVFLQRWRMCEQPASPDRGTTRKHILNWCFIHRHPTVLTEGTAPT